MLLSGYLNVCLKLLKFLCKDSREKIENSSLSHSTRKRGKSVRLEAANVELKINAFGNFTFKGYR